MYGIRSLQNGGAPKKLGKAEKYIPPELRPQAGALVDLIKWIKSNPYRAARGVAESFGPQADIKGMVDSYGSAVQNFRQGNIGAGLLDAAYVPANAMTLALPGSASGMRRAAEGLGGGAGKKADDLPMDEASRAYPIAPRDEWYGDANYQQTGGRIVEMTPDEFLAKARPMKIDDVARDNIDDLKRHMEEGRTLDPLAIYKNGQEDGRHRAIAARELGISRVPVLVWDDLPMDEASERAQEAIRGQADPIEQVAKESYARHMNNPDKDPAK